MTKLQTTTTFCIGLLALLSLSNVQGALISRLDGQAYYDTDLNITWLADANYAYTSGYIDTIDTTHGDGRMNWQQAYDWASQLEFGGSTDWRLPQALPVNGVEYIRNLSFDGSTDVGYNITSPNNELSYMFLANLQNSSFYDTDGNIRNEGDYGLQNIGVFTNLYEYYYWTNNTVPDLAYYSWGFSNIVGGQRMYYEPSEHYAWAVMDGDIATVPVPAGIYLIISGGLGLLAIGRGASLPFRRRPNLATPVKAKTA